MAATDQLAGLSSLINLVKGQSSTTKTSGGTTTQQTNVSDQGVQQLLDQILSGPGGVKTVGLRARSSGLYNSSTEDDLLGKLYATAANQAELARTPTVTTTAPQTSTTTGTKVGAGELATGLGGAFLASQALNLGAKALSPAVNAGADYVTDLVSNLFGVGTGTETSSSPTSKKGFGDIDLTAGGGFGGTVGDGSTSIATGEGYGIDTSTLGSFGGSSSVPGAVGFNFGVDADSGAGSIGLAGLGGLLGGLINSSGGGGRGGSSGGSVICTALKDLGLLDKELHAAGAKYLNSMHPYTVIGYQVWGNKVADKIRKGHKGWTKVALPIARSRTALLASSGSFMEHIKNPLGTLTKFVGEPICHIIGLCIPEDLAIPMMCAYFNQKGV